MAMFRSKGQRICDQARSDIAGAEMRLAHSFTPADILAAKDELAQAQRYLARAKATLAAWQDAIEQDEYEAYPDVPRTDTDNLI